MKCNSETQKSVDISTITQYLGQTFRNLEITIIKILAKLGVFFQSLIKTEKSTYKGLKEKINKVQKKVVNMPKVWIFFYIQKVQ